MKKIILIISVLIFLENQTFAQNANEPLRYNKKGSLVWISLTNGAELGKGLLWKVSEDTLEFGNLYYKNKNPYFVKVPSLKIHYSEIKELKTTPRAAIKKGMWAGAAIGLASGLAIGMATTEIPILTRELKLARKYASYLFAFHPLPMKLKWRSPDMPEL